MNMSLEEAKKKKLAIAMILIPLVLFGSLGIGFYASNSLTLVRPMLSVPVIRTQTDGFTIEAESKYDLLGLTSMELTLESEFGDFDLLVKSFDLDGKNVKINVEFGNVLLDVLYDLRIKINGFEDFQPNAVKVISSYKSTFNFIIWSDPQIDLDDEDDRHNTIPNMYEVAREINLIHPEFVIMTGDLTEWATPKEFELLYNVIDSIDVPVYTLSGNHDKYTPGEYIRYFRHLDYSFNYGSDFHFTVIDTGINLDSLDDQTYEFLEQDIIANKDVPHKFIAQHAPPFYIGPNRNMEYHREDYHKLVADYDIDACLYGHVHKDHVWDDQGQVLPWNSSYDGAKYIATNDGREEAAYRVISIVNGEIDTYSIKNATDTYDDQASMIAGKLYVNYTQANDGTELKVDALVTNMNDFQGFTQIVVPFHVLSPGGNPTFTSNGTMVQYTSYPLENKSDEYTVKLMLNIPGNTSYSITVQGIGE